MDNKIFGEVKFNMGWETKKDILFFDTKYKITVSAAAYYETDKITEEQEISYSEFLENEKMILNKIQEQIDALDGKTRYIPCLLLIQENGDYALIFDDKDDVEAGIAVTIKPEYSVLDTDQYL